MIQKTTAFCSCRNTFVCGGKADALGINRATANEGPAGRCIGQGRRYRQESGFASLDPRPRRFAHGELNLGIARRRRRHTRPVPRCYIAAERFWGGGGQSLRSDSIQSARPGGHRTESLIILFFPAGGVHDPTASRHARRSRWCAQKQTDILRSRGTEIASGNVGPPALFPLERLLGTKPSALEDGL